MGECDRLRDPIGGHPGARAVPRGGQALEDLASKKIPGGKQITCGIVHVSQGRQAPVVVLAGTTPGARSWAAERPNLLNVAVSRAEHRLDVVGNQENWADKRHFSTLAGRLPVRRFVDDTQEWA
jgi:superfamily I DNA and/or RNA helicase